jgi:hypothetical protein
MGECSTWAWSAHCGKAGAWYAAFNGGLVRVRQLTGIPEENPDLAIEIENKVRSPWHSSSLRRSSQSTPTPPHKAANKG